MQYFLGSIVNPLGVNVVLHNGLAHTASDSAENGDSTACTLAKIDEVLVTGVIASFRIILTVNVFVMHPARLLKACL